jgi:1-acyl-sn-glycerol-3-phosphate acyltransferase
MIEALDQGSSLVLFPEGTRNTTEAGLLPFRSGLYHLARARPGIDLVPVWIDNLGRVMPKGGFVPVPMLCTVAFGSAMRLLEGETKEHFLDRAAARLAALSPREAAA